MNKFLSFLSLLLIIILSGAFLPSNKVYSQSLKKSNNRLLVKFSQASDKKAIIDKHSLKVISEIPQIGLTVLEANIQAELIVDKIKKEKVEYAEVDGETQIASNDSLYTIQWGLTKIEWNKLDASSSAYNPSSPSVKIAVIDTGVDYNHPDLIGKVDTNLDYDFVNNDDNALDDHYHGTHVAGIAAASSNNSNGIAGVSFNTSSILPIKVLDQYGSGYYSWMISGIIYASDNNAKVINLSLGGSTPSLALQDAINHSWGKGSLIVAAAGNNGTTSNFYPAAYSNSIAVWASDSFDKRAYFSTYGSWVDLGAPGVNIISTIPLSMDNDGNPDGYTYLSGTSMASPHVAGLAGLIASLNPTWTNLQIRSKLETSVDPSPDRQFKRGKLGKGRINVYKATQ